MTAPETSSDKQPSLQSRQIALDFLISVLDQKQLLDVMLDRHALYARLDKRDRAFTRMIVSTTLRKLGQIDDLIRRASTQSRPPSPPALYNLLRLTVCQIVFMDVPDYAAIDSAVNLAAKNNLSRQKGFVNGLLRTIARQWKDWLCKQDGPTLNTPDWLLKDWIQDYGLRSAGETALASQNEAATDISLKSAHDPNSPSTAPSLEHWGEMLNASVLPTGSLRLHGSRNITELHGFEDGEWWVQDASSALPARLFGMPLAGKTIIDLCAAPGGKTAQLAAAGANVIAVDRSASRMKRLHENIERLKLTDNVHAEIADGSEYKPPQPVDGVLVDVPCSATGTIRRHPDVMHLRTPQDIERLQVIQQKLIANAYEILKPGGTLIFCTCSLQKSEGEQQISDFLAGTQTAKRAPFTPDEVGDMNEIINNDGDIRVLPQMLTPSGGMDGFFVSRIIKS